MKVARRDVLDQLRASLTGPPSNPRRGIDYSGATIHESTHKAAMEQPIKYWVPSIAPSGMAFYTGDLFMSCRRMRTMPMPLLRSKNLFQIETVGCGTNPAILLSQKSNEPGDSAMGGVVF